MCTLNLPRHLVALPLGACPAELSATSTRLSLYGLANSNRNTTYLATWPPCHLGPTQLNSYEPASSN